MIEVVPGGMGTSNRKTVSTSSPFNNTIKSPIKKKLLNNQIDLLNTDNNNQFDLLNTDNNNQIESLNTDNTEKISSQKAKSNTNNSDIIIIIIIIIITTTMT